MISNFEDKLAQVSNLLDLDDQYDDTIPIDKEDAEDEHTNLNQTLKASCSTRWNSTLLMQIESIINLERNR